MNVYVNKAQETYSTEIQKQGAFPFKSDCTSGGYVRMNNWSCEVRGHHMVKLHGSDILHMYSYCNQVCRRTAIWSVPTTLFNDSTKCIVNLFVLITFMPYL